MKFLLFLCMFFGLAVGYAAPVKLAFDVYLDDSKIGLHEVKITSDGDEKQVKVQANMQVKLLFVTVFDYQHQARERWQQGCIVQLNTQTNDDGEALSVTGKQTAQGFEVIDSQEHKVIDDCVRTYAYWDRQLLASDYLLNTQNGRYEPARLVSEGSGPLQFNGANYGSQRYRLEVGEAVSISLWYGDDDSWQALETKVDGDRVLRYLRREINS